MSIEPDLAAALRRLAAQPSILVGVDFDGTLAPFESDPAAAAPTAGGLQCLRSLAAAPGLFVAVVSGRDLESLGRVTGIGPGEAITLIGSHGAQRSTSVRPTTAAGLPDRPAEVLRELTASMTSVQQGHPGSRIEHKRAAVALHTRGLPEDISRPALADALALAADRDEVHVITGKDVVELAVLKGDKGTAVRALADERSAAAVCYIGDDTTDERAFEALREPLHVTVKVGDGSTAARYRVTGVAEVVEVLRALAELRTAERDG